MVLVQAPMSDFCLWKGHLHRFLIMKVPSASGALRIGSGTFNLIQIYSILFGICSRYIYYFSKLKINIK